MESTGVYWIPVWNALEGRSLSLTLVNARRKFPISPTENSPALAEWWLTVSGYWLHHDNVR
jgi:hypothetical protein